MAQRLPHGEADVDDNACKSFSLRSEVIWSTFPTLPEILNVPWIPDTIQSSRWHSKRMLTTLHIDGLTICLIHTPSM